MEICSLCTKPTPPEALDHIEPGIPVCRRCVGELNDLCNDRRDAWIAAVEAEAGLDLTVLEVA